ncbi:unnamed protein product, partial [Didymodactylos carnosus]
IKTTMLSNKKSDYSQNTLKDALRQYKTGSGSSRTVAGRKWLNSFLGRNKGEIKLKKEEKLDSYRKNGFTENVRRAELVVVSSNTKHVYEQNGGTGKQYTTVVVCTSADGRILAPMIIYSAKNLNNLWCTGGPSGTTYSVSDSGWITEELFIMWFTNFIDLTKTEQKPILLLMDSHAAHISIQAIELAKQNGIILLLFPPHCTHGLQPLDVVTFSSAKQIWKKIVTKYINRTQRKTIRKLDLPGMINQLFQEAFTPRQVVAGFARAGVWPFDKNAMKEKVAKKQGISLDQPDQPIPQQLDRLRASSGPSTQPFQTVSALSLIPPPSILDNDDDNDDAYQLNALQKSTGESATTAVTFQSYKPPSSYTFDLPSLGNTSSRTLINSSSLQLQEPSSSNTFNYNSSSPNQQLGPDYDYLAVFERDDSDDDYDEVNEFNGIGRGGLRTFGRYNRSTRKHQEQYVSNNDLGNIDDDNSTQTYAQLTSVDMTDLTYSQQSSTPAPTGATVINASLLSPVSAVRSIVSSVVQQFPQQAAPVGQKTSNRIRVERQYGENITSGNLLTELKEKQMAKTQTPVVTAKRGRGRPRKNQQSTFNAARSPLGNLSNASVSMSASSISIIPPPPTTRTIIIPPPAPPQTIQYVLLNSSD